MKLTKFVCSLNESKIKCGGYYVLMIASLFIFFFAEGLIISSNEIPFLAIIAASSLLVYLYINFICIVIKRIKKIISDQEYDEDKCPSLKDVFNENTKKKFDIFIEKNKEKKVNYFKFHKNDLTIKYGDGNFDFVSFYEDE